MSGILIVGATSAIAEATARLWAMRKERLFLAGRDRERLSAIAADLEVRSGLPVGVFVLDCNDIGKHAALLAAAREFLGEIDIVLVAFGTMADQAVVQDSVPEMLNELSTNGTSVVALVSLCATEMQRQGHGVIAAISSPAGDRGRQSNYVYGAAKAMVTTFLSGLRNRFAGTGVHVITLKPAFIDSPMTARMTKGRLWTTPHAIAPAIVAAIDHRRDEVYLPRFWFWIMLAIKLIPEAVFKRLKL